MSKKPFLNIADPSHWVIFLALRTNDFALRGDVK